MQVPIILRHPIPGGVIELPIQESLDQVSMLTLDTIISICWESRTLSAPPPPFTPEQKVLEALITSHVNSRIGTLIGTYLGVCINFKPRGFHEVLDVPMPFRHLAQKCRQQVCRSMPFPFAHQYACALYLWGFIQYHD